MRCGLCRGEVARAQQGPVSPAAFPGHGLRCRRAGGGDESCSDSAGRVGGETLLLIIHAALPSPGPVLGQEVGALGELGLVRCPGAAAGPWGTCAPRAFVSEPEEGTPGSTLLGHRAQWGTTVGSRLTKGPPGGSCSYTYFIAMSFLLFSGL